MQRDTVSDRSPHGGGWPFFQGLLPFLLFFLVVLVYFPALRNGFVPWDDGTYILKNEHIRMLTAKSLGWMFSTFYAANWHPLTWLSHALDYAFWGDKPFGHHLTSILLHGLNTVLVFFIMNALLTGNGKGELPGRRSGGSFPFPIFTAAMTALLFGLHPLRVESVAWVSERKDLLCAFFYLSGVLVYLRYIRAPNGRRKWALYGAVLFLFCMSLMSKPMAVTFPVVLLILDFILLRRNDSRLRFGGSLSAEKVPFFILSAASGVVTMAAQQAEGAVASLGQVGVPFRFLNAMKSLIFYLAKFCWPRPLSPLYEFPPHTARLWFEFGGSLFLVFLFSGFALRMLRRGRPLWIALWGYYLVTLLPVLGIIQAGRQTAADRYTYLPGLAPSLLAGLAFAALRKRLGPRGRTWSVVGGILLVSIFSLLTVRQIRVWKNGESLWRHAAEAYPRTAWLAYYNLSFVYADRGDFQRAMDYYRIGLRINPTFVVAINSMGKDLAEFHYLDAAVGEFRRAIQAKPEDEVAYANLAHVLIQQRKMDQAEESLHQALKLKPDYSEAHRLLGAVYLLRQKLESSIVEFQETVRLNPKDKDAFFNMGIAFGRLGRFRKAAQAYGSCLEIDSNNAAAWFRLSRVLRESGDMEQALTAEQRAAALGFPVP